MNSCIRKIIHVDMDCFYAAVEMRDNPELRDKPIAVGGDPDKRGVIATSNYLARQYGVRSAMASAHALKLCPQLQLVKGHFDTYREISENIQAIFANYTHLVEPLSLDEAFLDVSGSSHCKGSATLIAQEICQKIYETQQLTASAGVAPNKFLAKIASDWNKPNGIFVIKPNEIDDFVITLPVKKIFGVGKVTEKKLAALNIHTCGDLQQYSHELLIQHLGKFGDRLYDLSRGIDQREVNPHRIRKSVSVEQTYVKDLPDIDACLKKLPDLYANLIKRLEKYDDRKIHKQFVKVKFYDFEQTTVETTVDKISMNVFQTLMVEGYRRGNKAVRLLGVGVGFSDNNQSLAQLSLEI